MSHDLSVHLPGRPDLASDARAAGGELDGPDADTLPATGLPGRR